MFLNVERAGDEHTDRYGSGSGNGCMEAWISEQMYALLGGWMFGCIAGCTDAWKVEWNKHTQKRETQTYGNETTKKKQSKPT